MATTEDGWRYVKPLAGPDMVSDFLESNGVKLPEGLSSFLAAHNGGRPPHGEFDTDGGKDRVFKCLLSYDPNGFDTVHSAVKALRAAGIDEALYPIGCDVFGNFVCYDQRHGGYALVDHETSRAERIISSSNPELFRAWDEPDKPASSC
jgi:hypothetical protein